MTFRSPKITRSLWTYRLFSILRQLDSGFPFSWKPELGARLGIMPRYGDASEVEWFDIDPCFVFHTFNAFETTAGQVILEGCRLESLNVQEFTSAESAPTPWGWSIDLANKRTQEGPILDLGMDFRKSMRVVKGDEIESVMVYT